MADTEDSSAMTIEFLRARLLSERSVSRSARQRADQLAKRVAELEEQLRIVTIQRKKAERAATEVLNIFESQGIGNFCEVVDSSSDKDENGALLIRTTEGSNTIEEDNSSNASGMQNKSEVDDGCSGSKVEVSPSLGKSLSWKGSRNGSETLERNKIIQTRQGIRRRAFIYSPEFSSKRQLGKSCRKLKRSDNTDTAVNGKNGNEGLGMNFKDKEGDDLHADDGSSSRVQDQQDTCNGGSKQKEDKLGCSGPIGEQNSKFFDSNFYASGVDKEEEMELALEKQAQLIDLYQAEENAQREWEEKFNENHSKMVSSQWAKDPAVADSEYVLIERENNGNASHIEGRSTKQAALAAQSDAINSEMVLSGASSKRSCGSIEQVALTSYNGLDTSTNCIELTPNGEATGLIDQRHTDSTAIVPEDVTQEFEFPGQVTYNGRLGTECSQEPFNNCSNVVSDRSLNSRSHVLKLAGNSSENISSLKFPQDKLPERQVQQHQSLPQSRGGSLEVLGSLQRAKMSLRQQLNRIPQPTSKVWEAATDSRSIALQQRMPDKGLNVPVGSASLFKLPTDPLLPSNLLSWTDIKSSPDVRNHNSDLGFTTSGGYYPEMISRTHIRPQDYDFRFTGDRLPPLSATRYFYPVFDSYPARNISSIGTQIPHMGTHDESSLNPYLTPKTDGIGPSWRYQ